MLRARIRETIFILATATGLCGQSVILGSSWFPIGPAPIVGGQTYGGGRVDVAGRSTVIAVNPTNPDDVWLGTAAGGVWHSVNGGQNWVPMSDDQESLAIGAIALDGCAASGCSVIYLGTGENAIRRDTYYGAGVLVGSFSGGEFNTFSWTQRGADLFRRASITKLLLDPSSNYPNKTIYVALSSGVTASASESTNTAPAPPMGYGVYKSTDTGASWTKLTVPGSDGARATDLEMDLGNPQVLYAGFFGKGVFKSTNGGANWCPITPGIALPVGCSASVWAPAPTSGFDFVEIALYQPAAATMYATLGYCPNPIVDSCGPAIYKSTDSGANWTRTRVEDPSLGLSFNCPRAYSRYTHALTVHPSNPATLYLGGTEMCRSDNSGANFTDLGSNTVHPDHHDLVFPDPANPNKLYDSSDGGFAYSTDGGISWMSGNTDLQITGFQSVASSPLTGRIIGGTQDNGTQIWMGSRAWTHINDGDSGFTIMDKGNANFLFDTRFELSPNRANGTAFGSIFGPALSSADPTAFYPPLVQDPNSPFPVYIGTNRLFKSGDRLATPVVWTAVSPDLGTASFFPDINGNDNITAITVAPSDSNRIYLGYYGGGLFVTNSACATIACWQDRGGVAHGLPAGVTITRIAVHPTNRDIAWVALSGFAGSAHIFKTTNAGANWFASAGGVPGSLAVNTISVEPSAASNLWAGTDRGVYKSTNGGDSWLPFNNGLPNAPVYEISIDETHRRVYAATHGRGMFVITEPFLSNFEGWVNNQMWDIPVYGNGFLPNQSCTMQIIRLNSTACATGSTDARGGTIETDSTGRLITNNGGFYMGQPVAFACFNGKCLGNTPITDCNQPGNPITSVVAKCGALTGVDAVLGCPRSPNPPSSGLGSGLGGGPAAEVGALKSAAPREAAGDGVVQLFPTLQVGDGSTRLLCKVDVPVMASDRGDAFAERARNAVNASLGCAGSGVRAIFSGDGPTVDREDEGEGERRMLLSAPSLSGGQLITSMHAAPGQFGGSCFSVDGLGVPQLNALSILRIKLETGTGGAAGGTIDIDERSPVGSCSILVPTAAGDTANQLAAKIGAAFQAPGIPGPHPRCPSRVNMRDITREADSIISVAATGLTLCVRDPRVGFSLSPEEIETLTDSQPPVTTATANPGPNLNGWNNTDVTVTLTATDNGGSGVVNIRYSATGAQPVVPTTVPGNMGTIVVRTEGITVITFYATDAFGNQEAPQSITVRIDKTKPRVTGPPVQGGCILSPADGRLVPLGTAAASDALSGLVPGSLAMAASSNEAQSGLFAGDQPGDIVQDGLTLSLRAERGPVGNGRVYTITATATDLAGNVQNCLTTCLVPK